MSPRWRWLVLSDFMGGALFAIAFQGLTQVEAGAGSLVVVPLALVVMLWVLASLVVQAAHARRATGRRRRRRR